MPISNSRLAYGDCYDAMNAALEDERGVRIKVKDVNDAHFLRMRMNQARVIDRDLNARTYEKGDPMYGLSEYDKLMIRIKEIKGRDGNTIVYLYLEQVASFVPEVENLSDVQDEVVAAPEAPESKMEPLSKPANNVPAPMITRRL